MGESEKNSEDDSSFLDEFDSLEDFKTENEKENSNDNEKSGLNESIFSGMSLHSKFSGLLSKNSGKKRLILALIGITIGIIFILLGITLILGDSDKIVDNVAFGETSAFATIITFLGVFSLGISILTIIPKKTPLTHVFDDIKDLELLDEEDYHIDSDFKSKSSTSKSKSELKTESDDSDSTLFESPSTFSNSEDFLSESDTFISFENDSSSESDLLLSELLSDENSENPDLGYEQGLSDLEGERQFSKLEDNQTITEGENRQKILESEDEQEYAKPTKIKPSFKKNSESKRPHKPKNKNLVSKKKSKKNKKDNSSKSTQSKLIE